MRQERRKSQRIPVEWSGLVRDTKGAALAEVKNIGTNGAFIRPVIPLMPQESFKLQIVVPQKNPLSIRAKVAWLRVSNAVDLTLPCKMGIRFIRVSKGDREFIDACILQGSRKK